MNDPIQPAHYRSHPSGVECIEITRHQSFTLGNAIKYVWRAGQKDDYEQDIRKALQYLEWALEDGAFLADTEAADRFITWSNEQSVLYETDFALRGLFWTGDIEEFRGRLT